MVTLSLMAQMLFMLATALFPGVRNNEFNHENLQLGMDEAHALGKSFMSWSTFHRTTPS